MSTLYRSLPSFATDYSGFLSVMHGLGGLMVTHDPSGCLGNYTNCDEPRWFSEPMNVFSSTLRELDAALGCNDDIICKIKKEIKRKRPPFVCILGTPIPALTGCDVSAIALEIENETGVSAFGIETDGFKFYDDGIAKALDLLYEHFMKKDMSKQKGIVNVIGMNALDYNMSGEKEKLTAFIESLGYKTGAFVGMGESLENIKNALLAEKNIIMSVPALKIAKKMQKEHGIPFFSGPPKGEYGLKALKAFLLGTEADCKQNENKIKENILIIGEQLCANALRSELFYKGYENVTVASFFKMEKSVMHNGDIKIKDEAMLENILKSGKFDTVYGDPLFSSVADNIKFVSCPHYAVSSRLYAKDILSKIG